MTFRKDTNSGNDPKLDTSCPVPDDAKRHDGQHVDHWVLPKEEREKGFIRPVRCSYKHLICQSVTKMPTAIAETYAREPHYYGRTFCVACGDYFPVGEDGEFIWDGTTEKVGT